MKSVLLDPFVNINTYILELLEETKKDYSDFAVVFSGIRPSHFLLKAISEKEKTPFIPPKVFSIDEFVNTLYDDVFSDDLKIDENDGISLLFDLHSKTKQRLGEDAYLSFDAFYSIGGKLYNDIEELIINLASSDKVKEVDFLSGEQAILTTINLKKLSLLYDSYISLLNEKNYSTRALRYAKLSKCIREDSVAKYKKVIFAGLFPQSKSEIEIFKEFYKAENTLFIFQDGKGIDDVLKNLDITCQRQVQKEKVSYHFYKSPDAHGQVFALHQACSKLSDEGKLNSTGNVIVLPRPDSLFPLLNHFPFFDDGAEYNVSMGYPLFRTPVFGFFNNILNLISNTDGERVYIKDYIKFILHPYTKNILYNKNASITRILMHTFEEGFAESKMRSFYTLEEIEGMEDVYKKALDKKMETKESLTLEDLKEHLKYIHDNTLGRLLIFLNIGDFITKSSLVIKFIAKETTASSHPYFNSFYTKFLKELGSINKSFIKNYSFSDTKKYFFLFQSVFKKVSLPFEGTPLGGLQVLGFLETRNIKFENVFFLDANEGVIPNVSKEESILPTSVREHLGVSTYRSKEKVAKYYFDVLVKSCKNAHFFYIDDNKTQRSRFLEELYWEEEKREGRINAQKKIKSIEYKINLKKEGSRDVEKTDDIIDYFKNNFRYSASAVNAYLHCGLKFYYTYALKLRDEGELAGDIEKKDIGTIVHSVLEKYFNNYKDKVLTSNDISLELLNDIINSEFKSIFSDNLSGKVLLIKNQISYQLEMYMKNFQLPLIEKHKIVVKDNELEISADIRGRKFKGIIDRVEKRDDVAYIIDYKTSSSDVMHKINFKKLDYDNRKSIEAHVKSLQIPFYLMIYSNHLGIKPSDLMGTFLLLGKSKIGEGIEFSPFKDKEEIDMHYAKLENLIFSLLDEICTADIPFRAAKNSSVCTFCDYKFMCKVN